MILTETITWIDVASEKPDSDITVLIKIPSPGEPVWFGYFSDESNQWMTIDNMPVNYSVTHWAQMPEGPKDS